ncbi:MAG: cyanophycin synthetase, partial [Elusimicrobiota bacterium]
FELLTAAAFHHFRETGAEVAVVEVGLGGRLDATNTLASPLLTVITSIGLDHTAHLGKTLSAIADEKAGILKPGVPCLCGEDAPEPLSRIRRRAKEAGAPLTQARTRLEAVATDWSLGRQRVILGGGAQGRAVPGARPFSSRAGGGAREFDLPLLGPAALRNAALVLDAVALLRERGLRIGPEAVARGFENARWPGRFQVVAEKGRTLVLDGAHNAPAMRAFLETWDSSPFESRPGAADALFIVGMLADKDVDGMLDLLASRARRAVAARAASPRALGSAELARRMEARGIEVVARAEDARGALKAWKADGARAAAVCGSFYLVGDALRVLR